MATGEYVTDRRRHREIMKDNNLVELGTDYKSGKTSEADVGAEVRADMKEVKERLEAGNHVNDIVGVTPGEATDIPGLSVEPGEARSQDLIRGD